MLTLPLQFEQCWTSTSGQLIEAEIACWGWRRAGVRNVKIRKGSGALLTRIWNQRGYSHDEELSMYSGEKNWVPNHSSRVKRPYISKRCKLWLNQQIRGTVRDASASGLVLTSVSYAVTPALENNDITLSPAGIQDEERFLNALVTCVPLRAPKDEKDSLIRTPVTAPKDEKDSLMRIPVRAPKDEKDSLMRNPVRAPKDERDSVMHNLDHREKAGRVPSCQRGGTREKEAKGVNTGKQGWRLQVEGLQLSPEIQQERMAANSDHVRQLKEKVLFLESMDVDTAKVFAVCPSIVNISIDKLKSVIDHLQSCGLRQKDLGRILSMTPQILGQSVKNHLRPTLRFLLKEVGLRRVDLRKVIIRCPRLLVASVDSQLRPTMHYLESLGFTSMASLVSNNATLLTFSIQSKLLPKLELLQTLGMSRDEAVTMVVRFPAIFNYGVEQNLQPKYDYLVNVMGRDVGHLKAFPQYFGCSLDYRIRPRHEFLLQRNIQMSLKNLLKPSDDEFYSRFRDRQVDESGTESRPALVNGSTVIDIGCKTPEIAVIDTGCKIPDIAAGTETANRRSIPVHI